MDDSKFIEYLLEKRVMRKTENMDNLHNIYASKYAKWIREYLNKKQIDKVPIFLACNTLYKLPDTFKIRENSFFVGDYGLFNYLYDWNYVLSNDNFHQFIVNLCIKQSIESYYLNDEIEITYWLCLHSDGLEEYKTEEYYNREIMTLFVDRTDIQEKFTMLHEAGHYLFRFINREKAIEQIKEIHEEFIKINKMKLPIENKGNNYDLDQKLYEECYCDLQAAQYIVQQFNEEESNAKGECYMLLFNTLFYVYILGYINTISLKNGTDCESYFDYQLWELTYRIGNMYIAFYAKLLEQENEQEMELLNKVYTEFVHMFSGRMKEVREIMSYIKAMINENRHDIENNFDVNDVSKINFIKEYLNLL